MYVLYEIERIIYYSIMSLSARIKDLLQLGKSGEFSLESFRLRARHFIIFHISHLSI